MMALNIEREAQQAIALIKSFSLELHSYSPESQVLYWLKEYRAPWIRDAIIEAVYQGRYKIISVQHILSIWQRRGQPIRHFTSGFEHTIAAHLGEPIYLPVNIASTPKNSVAHLSTPPTADQFIPMTGGVVKNNIDSDSWETLSSVSHQDSSRLAIESFPVDKVDTLVEVYQAKNHHQKSEYKESNTLRPQMFAGPSINPANASSLSAAPPTQSKVYATQANSIPIQPFRPTPRKY